MYLSVPLLPFVLDRSRAFGASHDLHVSQFSFFSILTSSVNIPWSKGGKGDVDYISAFERVVMPISREFAPEIVLGRCPPLHVM